MQCLHESECGCIWTKTGTVLCSVVSDLCHRGDSDVGPYVQVSWIRDAQERRGHWLRWSTTCTSTCMNTHTYTPASQRASMHVRTQKHPDIKYPYPEWLTVHSMYILNHCVFPRIKLLTLVYQASWSASLKTLHVFFHHTGSHEQVSSVCISGQSSGFTVRSQRDGERTKQPWPADRTAHCGWVAFINQLGFHEHVSRIHTFSFHSRVFHL